MSAVASIEFQALITAMEVIRNMLQGDAAWVGNAANLTRFPR